MYPSDWGNHFCFSLCATNFASWCKSQNLCSTKCNATLIGSSFQAASQMHKPAKIYSHTSQLTHKSCQIPANKQQWHSSTQVRYMYPIYPSINGSLGSRTKQLSWMCELSRPTEWRDRPAAATAPNTACRVCRVHKPNQSGALLNGLRLSVCGVLQLQRGYAPHIHSKGRVRNRLVADAHVVEWRWRVYAVIYIGIKVWHQPKVGATRHNTTRRYRIIYQSTQELEALLLLLLPVAYTTHVFCQNARK